MSDFQKETLFLFIMLILAFWKMSDIFIYLMSKIGVPPIVSSIIFAVGLLLFIRYKAYKREIEKIRKRTQK